MDLNQSLMCGPSLEPQARLKILTQYGNSVDIDSRVPPRRYYRSGLEMVRMANSYYEEGSLENAFTLYMKFVVLFLEKIRSHPEFASVSQDDKAVNAQKLREVLPRAEELKSKLITKFTAEYEQFLKQEAEREKNAAARSSKPYQLPKSEYNPQLPIFEDPPEWEPVPRYILPTDIDYPEVDVNEEPSVPVPDRSLKPNKLDLPTAAAGIDPTPSVDRSNKPLSLLSPSIHSRLGHRAVIVPTRLMQNFLSLAQKNTERNIETCGVLAGTLNRDQLMISHLLVPNQSGTSDSCTTMNEEELFDYQDQHDLITFGWIHTHPSQTAFLSSVDLHTHCSYQRMMPEAIAIVCAPRYKETGVYMLTPNYGLDFIANCRSTGFHPHPSEPPLFMDAQHAILDSNVPIEVIDLRR